MLWDESFVSWQTIGITSQPSAVMLAPDGTPLEGWVGMYDEATVLELAAEYAST
jgi:hypothetical protein